MILIIKLYTYPFQRIKNVYVPKSGGIAFSRIHIFFVLQGFPDIVSLFLFFLFGLYRDEKNTLEQYFLRLFFIFDTELFACKTRENRSCFQC